MHLTKSSDLCTVMTSTKTYLKTSQCQHTGGTLNRYCDCKHTNQTASSCQNQTGSKPCPQRPEDSYKFTPSWARFLRQRTQRPLSLPLEHTSSAAGSFSFQNTTSRPSFLFGGSPPRSQLSAITLRMWRRHVTRSVNEHEVRISLETYHDELNVGCGDCTSGLLVCVWGCKTQYCFDNWRWYGKWSLKAFSLI